LSSLAAPELASAARSLPLRLRAATAGAHRDLETALDLLADPLSRDRLTAVLMGFWGFHAAWEPQLLRQGAWAGLMAGRLRQDLIAGDLMALGLSQADIEALPRCAAAAELAAEPAPALGSIYVLEGSSLGGKIISRALSRAPWAPPGGLRYFDPYGERTGPMWRAFQGALTSASTPATDPAVETGALETFALLQRWLAPADPQGVPSQPVGAL
jgi:heme oxygenase